MVTDRKNIRLEARTEELKAKKKQSVFSNSYIVKTNLAKRILLKLFYLRYICHLRTEDYNILMGCLYMEFHQGMIVLENKIKQLQTLTYCNQWQAILRDIAKSRFYEKRVLIIFMYMY